MLRRSQTSAQSHLMPLSTSPNAVLRCSRFWQTKAEASGGLAPAKVKISSMLQQGLTWGRTPLLQDPLALIGLLGILLPFVILGIAIGTGCESTASAWSLQA